MAVQKSRVTRSRRGMRRSHDGLKKVTLSTDSTTGKIHRRHHISSDGYYKGRLIIDLSKAETEDENDNSEA